MRLQHIFLALLATMVWGGNFVAVKLGQAYFPLIFMIGFRFAIQGIAMGPFVPTPKTKWKEVFLISFTFCFLNFFLLYIGIRTVSASLTAIIHLLAVPLAALLGWVLLQERITKAEVLGIAVAFLGVMVIVGIPKEGGSFLGILAVVAAAFFSGLGQVLTKKFSPLNSRMVNGWTALMAAPPMLLASFLLEDGQITALQNAPLQAWGILAFSTFISGMLGFAIWYKLLNLYPISKVVVWGQLVPVWAILFSVLFLHEHLTWRLVIGDLLTIAGVTWVQLQRG